MRVRFSVLFFTLITAGCASAPQPDARPARSDSIAFYDAVATPVAEKGKGTVCRLERRTGTNIATTVCRSAAQREADRQQAVEFMRSALTTYR